jgi:tetratricopeptide (TPR) repeat protein
MRLKTRLILVAAAAAALATAAYWHIPQAAGGMDATLPPAVLLPSDQVSDEQTMRFLERKVKADPEDFIAHNKLAFQYLKLVRETSDLTYLNLASRAAHASLAALPAEHNSGGLTMLSQVEFTAHDFAAARDHARRLIELDPEKSYPYQMLGDALLELGDYDQAKAAYGDMVRYGAIQGLTQVAAEQRMARLAALRGDMDAAYSRFLTALKLALALPAPPAEAVAWCRWQLGETAFAIGKYPLAERHYRDALTTFPGYVRAEASLAKVRAARGDLNGAIELYRSAVRAVPDPSFAAALGDLEFLAGRPKGADAQYELVRAIYKLWGATGSLYNRQQALFEADHDTKAQEAFENAKQEFAVRRDIYGSDAVAWTALRAGHLAEAKAAITDALRLGTQDAKLFYHAGMIARAMGEGDISRQYLRKALALNPGFDLLQAANAKRALDHAD